MEDKARCIIDEDSMSIHVQVNELDMNTEQDEPGYIRHAGDIEYEILITRKKGTPLNPLMNWNMTDVLRMQIWQDLIPIIDYLRSRFESDGVHQIIFTSPWESIRYVNNVSATAENDDTFWQRAHAFIFTGVLDADDKHPSFSNRSFYMSAL